MHEIFSPEPDPVEAMLRPPSPQDNEKMRQTVYIRTKRVLHRRRRLRQFVYAASLLVSFAIGAGVMRLTIPGERRGVSPPVETAKTGETDNTGEPTPDRSPVSEDSALASEWLAFDSEEHRSELYRQAGDRYIMDEKDPQSALRCYSNALDSGTEQDLTISTEDSFLLMAIKDARQKERNHAKTGG